MAESTVENTGRVGIRAKYIGPGNVRGSRWRVWRADETWAGDPDRLEVPYFHELSSGGDNAAAAVREYLARKGDGWDGRWVVACGSTDGYVAVMVTR